MKAQVDEKVFSKAYNFEDTVCPVCNIAEFEPVAEKDRYGLYFPVKICKKCGLIQTNPRMDQDSYIRFYDSEYRKLYLAEDIPSSKQFSEEYYRAQKMYLFLKQNKSLPKAGSAVFEVGCGTGGILKYFKEKDFNVKGVDLDNEYLNYGKSAHGLDLSYGFLKDIPSVDKFDIIIYSQVLEHILNLPAELEIIKKHLNTDGILYIEVPGVKNLENSYSMDIMKYLQNAHTFHFTLTTLSNVLTKNGFSVIAGNEVVRCIAKVDNFSTPTQVISDYNAVISFLQKLERKRKYYFITPDRIKYHALKFVGSILKMIGLYKLINKYYLKSSV